MATLELTGYGVRLGKLAVAGVDLAVEPGTMLALVCRRDGSGSLLGLAMAGLLPRGAATEGKLVVTADPVIYLDRNAEASDVPTDAVLIVADEPGRGRDPASQFALLTALQRASRKAAVVIVTADFRLALSMGLEVAVIAGGKLLLNAPASQIFELPQYDTIRNVVGGQRLRTRTLMRPPIGEPVLELDGASKAFRRGLPRLGPPPLQALEGIGFAVRQGEVVGVLGGKGAGKTTLLRLIAGLDAPSSGQIRRRQGPLAYVFRDPHKAFNPALPVGMSLTEPLRVEQTLLVEEQADRLVEVVRAVDLEPDLMARLPGELGAADLQRMALARALAGRPNLILLDDPTACLDPAETREFLVLFSRVRADFGLTAIVASAEFEVMRAVADRLLVLDAGRIVEGGKPAELIEAPKQETTRRLVSARYPKPIRTPVPEEEMEITDPGAIEPAVSVTSGAEARPGGASPAAAPQLEEGAATDAGLEVEGGLDKTPEPGPVPTLSAEIVIAAVVPDDAVPTLPGDTKEPAQTEPQPSPDTHAVSEAAILVESVPPETADAGVTGPAVVEPVPPVEPEAAPPAQPEAEAPPLPRDAAENPVPSDHRADEAAESREAEVAVDGLIDTPRRADPPDGETGR